jgi:hypothetical protein
MRSTRITTMSTINTTPTTKLTIAAALMTDASP